MAAGIVLLVICAACILVIAHLRGMAREAWHTLAALAVLVVGTRVTFATGWWGIAFWPLTFLATGWVLLAGVRDGGR